MATLSSILGWEIPWTEEPGGLQSIGSQKSRTLLNNHKRGKKQQQQQLSTNLTLHEAYRNHWTNLYGAEIKRKKEFNLEAWEKETSNTIS